MAELVFVSLSVASEYALTTKKLEHKGKVFKHASAQIQFQCIV